jgi:hypothetical protein
MEIINWPYGGAQMLDRLLESKPTFAADPRFIRLRRVLDRRLD